MKRILLILVCCLTGTALFAQSDELNAWSEAYDGAQTVAEQLIYIQNVADGQYAGSEVFFARALDRLLMQYPNISTRSEWDAADSCARILAAQLGNAQYKDAALNLWRTVDTFPNPLVKAEALIALGKIGDTAFLPQIVKLLNDLNNQPQADLAMREHSERIAYGAIISLENYKAPEGFLPVFFASTGWYSDRIRNQASISLMNIMDDPTDQLLQVITSPGYTYDIKHLALRTSERSQSSGDNKARVAVAALAEGWKQQVSDLRQRQELTNMRKLAINMIRLYKTQDASVYPQLDRSYQNGAMDEKLGVLYALDSLSSEDSARLLSGYLRTIHQRRTSNTLTSNDEQLIRVIIPAMGNLGATGRTLTRPILLQVQQSPDWTNTVKNLASDALRKIGN
ncbi:MAG: hypothetical protein FWF22_03345 [Treponema sp.]|nr:hypothetical protein [Treponema sp.]